MSYANEIAITFDDLPSQQNELADKQEKINKKILDGLAKFNVSVVGFVNEGKLYGTRETNRKIAILKQWIDKGHSLGNHTYSHMSLNQTELTLFENDVLKGANVSKKLMSNVGREYKYFRYPYLNTGKTKEIRIAFEAFLQKEGYIVAPITIDTEDWKFNRILRQNPKKKDEIIKQYLEHTRKIFTFHQTSFNKNFGRNSKDIWLLHVNQINADTIEDLLKIAQEFNYNFISLDDALKNKIYAEKSNYYNNVGISWLHRKDFAGRTSFDDKHKRNTLRISAKHIIKEFHKKYF